MSEDDSLTLSCPYSVAENGKSRIFSDHLPNMHSIIKDIEKHDDLTIIRKLTELLNMASKADVSADFQTCDGPKKILGFIDNKNRKIAKLTFLILGQHISKHKNGTGAYLMNMHVFGILSKKLEDINALSYNYVQSALFFLSSVITLDKIGQVLVRKSKCLHCLIALFLRILPSLIRNENWEEEKEIRESKGHRDTWTALCLSIKRSIYDPQNKTNQQLVNTIVPKSINFLSDWIFYAKENDSLQEFALSTISLLVQILFHNQINQTCFAAYSGISLLIKGVKRLQGLSHRSNGDIKNKLIRLLNAAISGHKENCLLTVSLGGMHMLLELLKKLPDNKKFPVIVTLTHLVQRGDENDEKFVKTDGLAIVALATVNMDSDPAERQAASKLLKVWAAKISRFNNQHKQSVENDQPFKDNTLLKLKISGIFRSQIVAENCSDAQAADFRSSSMQGMKTGCEELKTLDPTKKKKMVENLSDEKNIGKSMCLNTTSDTDENKMIIKEQIKINGNSRDVREKCWDEKEIEIDHSKRNIDGYNSKDSTIQTENTEIISEFSTKAKRNNSKLLDPHKKLKHTTPENLPGYNYDKKSSQEPLLTTHARNTTIAISPSAVSTNFQQECVGFTVSEAFSPARQLSDPHTSIQNKLNKSSDSEYATALDTSFLSENTFSSGNAVSNVSTVDSLSFIDDMPTHQYDGLNYDGRIGDRSQSFSANINSDIESENVYNTGSNSSSASVIGERANSYKRNRGFENFVSDMSRVTASDRGCLLARHSTPKKKQLSYMKLGLDGINSKRYKLGDNFTLPSSYAGFSAAMLNSSISSSNRSSRPQLFSEEIQYLEQGKAEFGNNSKGKFKYPFNRAINPPPKKNCFQL